MYQTLKKLTDIGALDSRQLRVKPGSEVYGSDWQKCAIIDAVHKLWLYVTSLAQLGDVCHGSDCLSVYLSDI